MNAIQELRELLAKPVLDQQDRKQICRLALTHAADFVEAVDALHVLCKQPSPDVAELTEGLKRGTDILIKLGVK
jgi:hypothetical protein